MSESEAVERNKAVNAEATRRLRAIAEGPVRCATGMARDAGLGQAPQEIIKQAKTGHSVGENIAEGKVREREAGGMTPDANSETINMKAK